MRTRWGSALGTFVVLAALVAGCSSSSSSQGITSTTAADAAPVTEAEDPGVEPTTATGSTETASGSDSTAAQGARGGEMTVGIGSDPPSLDPAGNSSSLENGTVYDAVYDRLMRYLPDGSIEPMLAETVVEAEDRLSWTMTLRGGVTFHDGTPFDAEAVKFNVDRQKTSPYNSPAIIPITSVDVVDELTVRFNLDGPWTALPNAFAGVVGNMAAPSAVASDPDGLLRNPLGTGPYRFVSWAPNDAIVVEKYPEYWNPDAGLLDRITYKLIPVEAARVAAFEAGELDVMLSINEETATALADFQVTSFTPTGYGLVLLNQTRPPFDDVRVRRALVLGSDRDAVNAAYQGQLYEDYAWSPFPKGSTWWSPPGDGRTLAYDPDAARALIEDYGQPVEFTMLVLAGNQVVEDSSRATVEYWAEVGIDAEIEIVPDLGTYATRVALTGDFEAVGWIHQSFGDPDVLYNQLVTGGSTNYGKYSNPRMDELLQQGRVETDPTARQAIYAEIQDLWRDDVPFVQTSHGPLYLIGNDGVTGLDGSVFFPARTAAFTG